MRISDWSSDVCSSDLFIRIACKHSMPGRHVLNISTGTKSGSCAGHDDHSDSMIFGHFAAKFLNFPAIIARGNGVALLRPVEGCNSHRPFRSEEHTSELQSLMRISYAVFCLKKKNNKMTEYY